MSSSFVSSIDLHGALKSSERVVPQSCRQFRRHRDGLIDMWRIIHHAYGRSSVAVYRSPDGSIRRLRNCPSAGARYPVRIGLTATFATGAVAEYVYCDDREELLPVNQAGAPDEEAVSFSLYTACNPAVSGAKYGPRGLVYSLLECGHASFNVVCAAKQLGYSPVLRLAHEGELHPGVSKVVGDHLLSAVITMSRVEDGTHAAAPPNRRVYFDAVTKRRSAIGFSGAPVSLADLPADLCSDEACADTGLRAHKAVLVNTGADADRFSILHGVRADLQNTLVDYDPCRGALGQGIAQGASGAVIYFLGCDPEDISLPRLSAECLAMGCSAQSVQLSLVDRGLTSSSIGAIDREYITALLGAPHARAIPLYSVVFGHPVSAASSAKEKEDRL